MKTYKTQLDQLTHIQTEMVKLLDEATEIVNDSFPSGKAALVKSYWIRDIATALGGDDYPTESTTMKMTIGELSDGLNEFNTMKKLAGL